MFLALVADCLPQGGSCKRYRAVKRFAANALFARNEKVGYWWVVGVGGVSLLLDGLTDALVDGVIVRNVRWGYELKVCCGGDPSVRLRVFA